MAETSVLHLFEYLCKAHDAVRPAQDWLLAAGFISTIVTEIDKIEGRMGDDRLDANGERLWAFLHMLKYCTASSVFADAICSHRVVSVLNRDVGDQPQYIEDARWLALASIYGNRTCEMMRGLFQSAIEVISDQRTSRTEASYAALRILQKMLTMDDVLRPFMADMNVGSIVINLLIENPDHSILQFAGRLLIVALFECPLTRPRAIVDCLPPIIAARATRNIPLRASLFTIVRAILKLRAGTMDLKGVPGFIDLVKIVRHNTDLMNSIYGGIPPLSER
jgi:hypothetical protein